MKKIDDILKNCNLVNIQGNYNTLDGKLVFDSREVEEGDLFIAVRGSLSDGHQYIGDAISNGAHYIVCEELPAETTENVTFILVVDSREALAIMASNYFGNPSNELKLTGVTGTNGKTTIATLLYELTESLGYRAGLLSTIQVCYSGSVETATHTTPDPIRINSILRNMIEHGIEYVFMEVSSHAIHQKRILGLKFTGGIFTNITHEHLDYHASFRDYIFTKKVFFDQLPPDAFALVNRDDRNGKLMLQNTSAKKFTYGISGMADFRTRILESHFEGNHLQFDNHDVWTRLPGRFNAYNLLAIYATGILLGFNKMELLEYLSQQKPVEGRFEILGQAIGPKAIVDYAHTPDALKNVLETIHGIRREENRIITVVGAGGNRDKSKRPLMAKIAVEYSDRIFLTSDNPRDEDPEMIISEMKEGLTSNQMEKVFSVSDREEAIKLACTMAVENDIILIAGKGHETYQEIKGVKYHFDDREKIRKYLKLN